MSKSPVFLKKLFVVILLSTVVSRKLQETAAIAEQSTVIIVFAFIYLASYLNERFTPKVNVLACGKFP